MRYLSLCLSIVFALGLCALPARAAEGYKTVTIVRGIDHRSFDRLLKKYVDKRGLVAYAAWKANDDDRAALDSYIRQYSMRRRAASGAEQYAGLANLYNALVLQWILQHYPVESIWRTDSPFKERRYVVAGSKVSLDDIENGALRPLVGYKAHAVLVCGARSCPPLPRFAYARAIWEKQVDYSFARWLAREDLNQYLPEKNRAEVSSIFKWFSEDFAKAGGLRKVLVERAPASVRDFLASGKYKIEYKTYHWGVNDQGKRGRNYGRVNLYLDQIF